AASGVTQAEAEHSAALAVVAQRQTELESAERRLNRSEQLARTNAISQQTLDDDRARRAGAQATLDAARAQAASAEAGIATARARIVDAEATIEATEAAIERIQVERDDSTLRSPRAGRVQYLVAQPGEVVAGGGRVLNLIDLDDVYMTFFLSTVPAGRVAVGSEARIVLDAGWVGWRRAVGSLTSDGARCTPRTCERSGERLGRMCPVRVRVPPALLRKYPDYATPGLRGIAHVELEAQAEWPASVRGG